MEDYQYLLNELKYVQHYAHLVCKGFSPSCAVDLRFQAEWEKLRDYIDVVAGNLEADIYNGDADTDTVERIILLGIGAYVTAASALRDGYVLAMAHCEEEHDAACPLRDRARQVLAEEKTNQP